MVGIKDVMARNRFKDILQDLHFLKNSKDCKVRLLIEHLQVFFLALFDSGN